MLASTWVHSVAAGPENKAVTHPTQPRVQRGKPLAEAGLHRFAQASRPLYNLAVTIQSGR